jgi:hypothetical protein
MAIYEMRLSLCRKLGYSDNPSVEVVNRLESFLNEIHRRLLGLPGLSYLRQTQTTLTTVANTATYTLPTTVARILGLRDAANDVTLQGRSWEWYQANVPDPTADTGTPEVWVPTGLSTTRCPMIAIWPTPNDAYTLTLDYVRNVDDLTLSEDVMLVPQDFEWVIESGAKMLEYEKTDDRRYPAARADYEKGIRDLKWFVTQQADSGGAVRGRSSLGPWYPAGS